MYIIDFLTWLYNTSVLRLSGSHYAIVYAGCMLEYWDLKKKKKSLAMVLTFLIVSSAYIQIFCQQ